MALTCSKCQEQNPVSAAFCRRCHTTLRYTCPSCGHIQAQGGACEQCGVDFQKYAVMLQFRVESELKSGRERNKSRHAILRQVVLLPLTGGITLMKFLKSTIERD